MHACRGMFNDDLIAKMKKGAARTLLSVHCEGRRLTAYQLQASPHRTCGCCEVPRPHNTSKARSRGPEAKQATPAGRAAGAFLVNNARGAICDAGAVARALESGQLGGVCPALHLRMCTAASALVCCFSEMCQQGAVWPSPVFLASLYGSGGRAGRERVC